MRKLALALIISAAFACPANAQLTKEQAIPIELVGIVRGTKAHWYKLGKKYYAYKCSGTDKLYMSETKLDMVLDKRRFSDRQPVIHGIYELGKIGVAAGITTILSINRGN